MTKKLNNKRITSTADQPSAQTQPPVSNAGQPQPINHTDHTDHTETERLLHELQVYQIELQLQNDELVESRASVEAGLRLYTDLYDFAPIGYLTLSFESTISQINLTGALLLGVDRAALVNRRFDLFVAWESRALFTDFLKRVFESEDKMTCEVLLTKAGHERVWVQMEGRATDDARQCHVVIMDISARVKAERRLQDSEKHFRMIAESAPMMVWLSGLNNENLYTNQRLKDFTGGSHDNQVARGWSHLVHPDDRDNFIQANDIDLSNHQAFELQYRMRRADGLYRWVVSTARPRFAEDGTFLGYIGTLVDVTERIDATNSLKESVERRTNELAQLSVLSQAMAFVGQPKQLLQLILENLRFVMSCKTASVYVKDGLERQDDLNLVSYQTANIGSVAGEQALPKTRPIHWYDYEHLSDVLERKQMVIISDVTSETTQAVAFRQWCVDQIPWADQSRGVVEPVGSWTGTALIVTGRAIGMLALSSDTTDLYTQKDVELLKVFANYAATAINNDRLKDSVARVATLAERTRIARELHDSVSQALFGIVLGTRTSQQLLALNQLANLPETLVYTTSLAEEALADMRSLILELHPDAVEREGLVVALQKKAAAILARHHQKIELELSVEPNVSLVAKEAIYRVIGEALQNTIKHAEASRITLALEIHGEETPPVVHARITDNGRGFDPNAQFFGHLGLHSMRERCELVNGTLDIHSAPGQGTKIVVKVPLQE